MGSLCMLTREAANLSAFLVSLGAGQFWITSAVTELFGVSGSLFTRRVTSFSAQSIQNDFTSSSRARLNYVLNTNSADYVSPFVNVKDGAHHTLVPALLDHFKPLKPLM